MQVYSRYASGCIDKVRITRHTVHIAADPAASRRTAVDVISDLRRAAVSKLTAGSAILIYVVINRCPGIGAGKIDAEMFAAAGCIGTGVGKDIIPDIVCTGCCDPGKGIRVSCIGTYSASTNINTVMIEAIGCRCVRNYAIYG